MLYLTRMIIDRFEVHSALLPFWTPLFFPSETKNLFEGDMQ